MKRIIFLLITVVFFSCEKDNDAQTNADLIISKNWYPYQVHLISYDNNTNLILKDTTYITQLCDQQSIYQFLPDSIVRRSFICEGIPLKEGKWYATADSISAYIPAYVSFGTGVILVNIGINKSKLIEINQSYFVTKETKMWFSFNGTTGITTYYRDEIFIT